MWKNRSRAVSGIVRESLKFENKQTWCTVSFLCYLPVLSFAAVRVASLCVLWTLQGFLGIVSGAIPSTMNTRDVVETAGPSKNQRPRLETSKSVGYAELFLNVLKNCHRRLFHFSKFFEFLAFYSPAFNVSCRHSRQKTRWITIILMSYRFNIESLKATVLVTETCSRRDWDSQKWVSRRVARPAPSLETPLLINKQTAKVTRSLCGRKSFGKTPCALI